MRCAAGPSTAPRTAIPRCLGYHPLVAVRADTGEVLHSRMRSGSSQRGHEHFARETLARVRRLAADASVTVRADSGFFSL